MVSITSDATIFSHIIWDSFVLCSWWRLAETSHCVLT